MSNRLHLFTVVVFPVKGAACGFVALALLLSLTAKLTVSAAKIL